MTQHVRIEEELKYVTVFGWTGTLESPPKVDLEELLEVAKEYFPDVPLSEINFSFEVEDDYDEDLDIDGYGPTFSGVVIGPA